MSDSFLQVTGFDPLTITAPSGAPGPQGAQGDPGPAPTLAIGNVTTLTPGASATATISGTSPNFTLDLGIPQGQAGSGGTGGGGLSITDNGDGTLTASATGVTDNGDGTLSA